MKDIFPYRLKSARKRAGLSLRQLSEEVGQVVTFNAIKKYEDGKMLPEKKVLLALAEALKVKLDYFSRPIKFDITDIEFRKKASLSVKQIDQLKEQTRDLLERYVEVEELCGIRTTFTNPVANCPILQEDDLETAADQLREHWKLGHHSLSNVIEILEEQEVKVLEIDASSKFDGLSAIVSNIPVTILNQNFGVERKRFTALHELGHLILQIEDLSKKELYCNRFAGAMLVPKSEMERILGKKRTSVPLLGELIPIKEEYGISLQAFMRRAYDLDIINQATYQKFQVQIARNREEEALGAFQGTEKAFRFRQLIFRLYAEDSITLEKAAALAGWPIHQFQTEFHRQNEDPDWSYSPELTGFSQAYGEYEPDYDFNDLIEINPDYDPR